MSAVTAVLQKYRNADFAPGGGDQAAALPSTERQALMSDLEKVIQRNRSLFWIIVSMLGCIFVLQILILFVFRGSPAIVATSETVLGLSSAGAIYWLINLWREKSSAELLLTLAVALGGDALQTVINVLVTSITHAQGAIALPGRGASGRQPKPESNSG
jgi:hypothetical protein